LSSLKQLTIIATTSAPNDNQASVISKWKKWKKWKK
jgi:hypothetical protein